MIKLTGKKEGRVVATDFTEDRDGERISVDGLDLKNFKKNPIMMFGHNHQNLPIGTATKIAKDNKRMTFEPNFSIATQFARDVKALWDEGVLKSVSIGFIPKEREKNVWTKSELLEISIVNVPSNPNALAMAKSKGLNIDILTNEVSGNKNLKTFPEDKKWDAAGAKRRIRKWAGGEKEDIDWTLYQQAFAYVDENDAKNFTSYKLPFADVEDGELKAVWKGIVAAQGALLGARGGVDIPEKERKEVHRLLGTYYKKFEKEQPEFKELDEKEIRELVENKLLSKSDAYDLLSLRSTETRKTKIVKVDNDAVMADALHLALQQIGKQSMKVLNKYNAYEKGKKPKGPSK